MNTTAWSRRSGRGLAGPANRLLAAALAGAWLVAAPAPARAGISEGVAWLVAHQDASGLWGEERGTPLRDACAAVEILAALGQGTPEVAAAVAALETAPTASADYLSRRIVALAAGGELALAAVLAADLAAMQNGDGGWGYGSGYASSNLETALALIALERAAYTNNAVLGAGVSHLKSHRNGDNAWSLTQGGTSEVFYTSLAVIALTLHADVASSATEVAAAVTWLRTQDHGDGGFGSGGASNPYETGLAIAAMVRGGWFGADVTAAQSYLEAAQLGDGSWDGDAYRTAMALYGLHHVGPDASILPVDVGFSIPSPLEGDVVQITAAVRNLGAVAASNVVTRIFDGDPGAGGVQIGSDVVSASIAAGGSANAQVHWNTAGLAGDHTLHVVVDPLGAILEGEEANNRASKFLHVRFPADLQIDDAGIAFTPDEPDTTESLTIGITVRNAGEHTATNVALQLWDGNPATGGIPLLAPYHIPSITAGSSFTLNVNMGTYFSTSGEYPIFACADVDATVNEIDETNNCNQRVLAAGRVRRSYTTYAGLDLVALPVTPLSATTSYSLLPEIPNATRIDRWNRSTQSYQSAQYSGGSVVGSLFSIDLVDGYFAHVSSGYAVDFVGRRVTTEPCTDLEAGLNLVSVPNENACYGAYDLIESMTGGIEAHRWNGPRQRWESGVSLGGTLVGEDFPVTPGAGYFVRVGSPSTWCVSPCDTVPALLPDLRVTSADILFVPNPVASGATVGIYVNIHNVGSVAVDNPRLDIFAGDPSAGGTQLLGASLPVSVPAGGSSGYWGNTFVFNGAGVVSIYGLADRFNVVTESNEANNQASAPLTVTAAPLEAVASGPPGAALADGAPKAPVYRLVTGGARPARASYPRASAAAVAGVTPVEATRGAAIAAATVIQGIRVAGQSSSSATISWVTDGDAGGCVRYGPTPALGFEACDGATDDLHVVTLEGLESETTYYFEVVSDDLEDDNGGSFHTFETSKPGAGLPSIVHGRVVEDGTTTGVEGVAVFATLTGAQNSLPLFGRSGPGGRFVLNLGNLKDVATNDVLSPPASGDLMVVAEAANTGHGSRLAPYGGTSPRDIGDIELTPGLVDVPRGAAPGAFALRANLPNPFTGGTVIGYDLPVRSPVRIEVFDLQGRRVRLLEHRAEMAAGSYRVTWDGRNDDGLALASGVYFYRLEALGYRTTRKAILSRD